MVTAHSTPLAALLTTLLGLIFTLAPSTDQLHALIIPPDGNNLIMSFVGKGVQIYRCSPAQSTHGGLSYQYQRAEADLFASNVAKKSNVQGYHYFLPHPDGGGGKPTFALLASPGDSGTAIPTSTATFKMIASLPSGDSTRNIPNLLLRATSHSGNGALSVVSYAQRMNSSGGVAPSGACLAEGSYIRVPYTARYQFWSQANIPPHSTPPTITIPTGSKTPFVSFFGQGFQIYSFNGSSWVLSNVSADLSTLPGNPTVGKHYFLGHPDANGGQPTWELFAPQGRVSAKPIQKAQKNPNDIPWLLAQATSYDGEQSFLSRVRYVQRLSTTGGIAPASTKLEKIGDMYQSPYTAIYSFYGA